MKRFLTGLLAAACLLTGCAAAQDTFSDIPEDAAYLTDVQYACQAGAMEPESRHSFDPDAMLTAGDAARLLTAVYDAQSASGEPAADGRDKEQENEEDCLARAA